MTIVIKGSTENDYPLVTFTKHAGSSGLVVTNNVIIHDMSVTTSVSSSPVYVDFTVTNRTPYAVTKITNNNPGVASLSGTRLTPIGPGGSVTLGVTIPIIGTVLYSTSCASTDSVTNYSNYIPKTGTLLENIWNNTAAMISGKTPGTSAQEWVSNSHNMFTYPMDLSFVSTDGSVGWCYSLISPWHVITSHVAATGNITFTQTDGTQVSRNIIKLDKFNTYSDQYIGILDSPITTITPVKVLPANVSSKLNGASLNSIPMIRKKQNGGNRLCIMGGISTSGNIYWNQHVSSIFSPWALTCTGGDSDGVVFVAITISTVVTPVLIHHVNWGSYPDGSYFGGSILYGGENLTLIQTSMNYLSTWARANGYAGAANQTLVPVDLTAWPNV
jgi:hypothetical protein